MFVWFFWMLVIALIGTGYFWNKRTQRGWKYKYGYRLNFFSVVLGIITLVTMPAWMEGKHMVNSMHDNGYKRVEVVDVDSDRVILNGKHLCTLTKEPEDNDWDISMGNWYLEDKADCERYRPGQEIFKRKGPIGVTGAELEEE